MKHTENGTCYKKSALLSYVQSESIDKKKYIHSGNNIIYAHHTQAGGFLNVKALRKTYKIGKPISTHEPPNRDKIRNHSEVHQIVMTSIEFLESSFEFCSGKATPVPYV